MLSGPAAAPVAAAHVAAQHGLDHSISVDMGGTSFDVCLINDRTPEVTTDGELAGYRIALPMVAINTIGAGGGSIIGVDARGMLTVVRRALAPTRAGLLPAGRRRPDDYRRQPGAGLPGPRPVLGRATAPWTPPPPSAAIRERVAEPLGLDVPTPPMAPTAW